MTFFPGTDILRSFETLAKVSLDAEEFRLQDAIFKAGFLSKRAKKHADSANYKVEKEEKDLSVDDPLFEIKHGRIEMLEKCKDLAVMFGLAADTFVNSCTEELERRQAEKKAAADAAVDIHFSTDSESDDGESPNVTETAAEKVAVAEPAAGAAEPAEDAAPAPTAAVPLHGEADEASAQVGRDVIDNGGLYYPV